MLVWDAQKFKRILIKADKAHKVGNFEFEDKGELYDYLSKEISSAPNTIEYWKCKDSNGPQNLDTIKQLEEIFGVSLRREVDDYNEDEERKLMGKHSDFVKKQIHLAYREIKDYLHSEDIEDEDIYIKMRNRLDYLKISIPKDIYGKIVDFADEYLEPIIYENDKVFANFYTEDIGHMGDDGSFHIDTKEQFLKLYGRFIEVIINIENKFDEFAMNELYPILVS